MSQKATTGDFFLEINPSNQATGSTQIIDLKGRQTITNSGEIVVAADGPFEGVKSLLFNSSSGARDYFSVANAGVVNTLTGDFTIEFWFKQTNRTPGNDVVLLASWIQSLNQGGWIVWSRGGNIALSFGPASEGGDFITTTVNHNLNVWNHVAVTRSGTVFTIWLNGSSVGTANSSATRAKINAGITSGAYQNSSGGVPDTISKGFNGYITGVKCYAMYAKYKTSFIPTI